MKKKTLLICASSLLLSGQAAAQKSNVPLGKEVTSSQSVTVLNRAASVNVEDFNFTDWIRCDSCMYLLDRENLVASFMFPDYGYNKTTLVIPSTINYDGVDYSVVSIGGTENDSSYDINNTIKSIQLPKDLRRIGVNAFRSYYALSEVVDIPASVEMFYGSAFRIDNAITFRMPFATPPQLIDEQNATMSNVKLIVPDGSFHAYRVAAVWGNAKIRPETPVSVTVTITEPGELAEKVAEAAGYLQEVNKLVVNGKVGQSDFTSIKSMSNLTELDLSGAECQNIPSNLFYENQSIENVILSSTISSIGSGAFYSSTLKAITMPEGLKTIDSGAFHNCQQLDSIIMPNSVTYVGSWAFDNCKALKKVVLSDNISIIYDRTFGYCTQLKEVVLPKSLKTIDSYAFSNCNSLEKVEFPEGLLRIGEDAFENTPLSEVVLPASLQYCKEAFTNNNKLKTIKMRALLPPETEGSWPVTSTNMSGITLYVPDWSLDNYRIAPGWSQLLNIEPSGEMPQDIVLYKAFKVKLSNEETDDYRPNISLIPSETGYYTDYGYDDYYYGQLTVESDGKLNVNNFSMALSPYAKWNNDRAYLYKLNGENYGYESTVLNPTCLKVVGSMRAENVELNLTLRNDSWQFISFPFDVKMSDIVPEDPATMWVVREYSGANRANGTGDTWLDVASDGVLKAGQGYIMRCYVQGYNSNNFYDSFGPRFTVSPVKESVNRQAIFTSTDRAIALEEYTSEFAHNCSWNLIGNPYPSFYDTRRLDFDGTITVWNSDYQSYWALNPQDDDYILNPAEAFFVQCPVGAESITFNEAGRQLDRNVRDIVDVPLQSRAIDTERKLYNITLGNGEFTDRTRVVINEAAKFDYELNRDASKFMSISENVPQLFTVNGNVKYAINERPVGNGEVALGFKVGAAGKYTIALAADTEDEVCLTDHLTGKTVKLSAECYVFESEAGEYNTRFTLGFGPALTGIDSVGADAKGADKGYTLDGKAVNNSYKGIVVSKNRKSLK